MKECLEIIDSRQFQRTMRMAANHTRKTGKEAGFTVWAENEKLYFSGVIGGYEKEIGGNPAVGLFAYRDLPLKVREAMFRHSTRKIFLIGDLHFHVSAEAVVIVPSLTDLESFLRPHDEECGYSLAPERFRSIGQVDELGRIDLLIIRPGQADWLSLEGRGYELLQFEWYPRDLQEEVNSCLRRIGLEVTTRTWKS